MALLAAACAESDRAPGLTSVSSTEVEPVEASVTTSVVRILSIPDAGLPYGMISNTDGQLGVVDKVAGHVFLMGKDEESFDVEVGHEGRDPGGVRCLSGAEMMGDSVMILDRCGTQLVFLRRGTEVRRQALELGPNSFAPPATVRFTFAGDKLLVAVEPIGGNPFDKERHTPVRLAVMELRSGSWEPKRLIPIGTNYRKNVGSSGHSLFVSPEFGGYVRWAYSTTDGTVVVSNTGDYVLELMDLAGNVKGRISVPGDRIAVSRKDRDSVADFNLSDPVLRGFVSGKRTEWPVASRKAAIRDLRLAPDGSLWVWAQVRRSESLPGEGVLVDRFVFSDTAIRASRFVVPCFPDAFVSATEFACLVDNETLDPKVRIHAVRW